MSTIKVKLIKRPTLKDDGLMVVMSPSGHGLACRVTACPVPECLCRDVHIDVTPIDFRVQKVRLKGDMIEFTSFPIGGLSTIPAERELSFVARLVPATGELFVEDRNRVTTKDAEKLLDPLREALDGELLDDFARFVNRLKDGETSDDPVRDPRDIRWKRGEVLGFEEVFELPRVDSYREGDEIWEAGEFFCPDPSCDCVDVVIGFLASDGSGDSSGSVSVNLETGEVELEHETDDEELVPRLWRRYVERHRGISHLRSRLIKMKEFGKSLTMAKSIASVERPKISRNAPCPCGSLSR